MPLLLSLRGVRLVQCLLLYWNGCHYTCHPYPRSGFVHPRHSWRERQQLLQRYQQLRHSASQQLSFRRRHPNDHSDNAINFITMSTSSSTSTPTATARPELVFSVTDYLQTIHATNPGVVVDYYSCTTGGSSSISDGQDQHAHAVQDTATPTQLVWYHPKIRLILASQSPRRKEIFDLMGLDQRYEVRPSPVNETQLQLQLRPMDPIRYTCILAEQKALAVAYDIVQQRSSTTSPMNEQEQQQKQPILILGSDTIVVVNENPIGNTSTTGTTTTTTTTMILEKPTGTDDAVQMLRRLQGQSHMVYTSVAIARIIWDPTDHNIHGPVDMVPAGMEITTTTTTATTSATAATCPDETDSARRNVQLVQSFVETATVHISHLTEIDIQSYVATGEPMDKAGAYGIQGMGGQIVSSMEGDFFTVRFLDTLAGVSALYFCMLERFISSSVSISFIVPANTWYFIKVMGLPMHQTSRALTSSILDILRLQQVDDGR
jgi:septum formation protein